MAVIPKGWKEAFYCEHCVQQDSSDGWSARVPRERPGWLFVGWIFPHVWLKPCAKHQRILPPKYKGKAFAK